MHISIKRCCTYNTGQAFYDLQSEYKSVLVEYAAILTSKLPKSSGTDNGEATYKYGEGDDIPKLACKSIFHHTLIQHFLGFIFFLFHLLNMSVNFDFQRYYSPFTFLYFCIFHHT